MRPTRDEMLAEMAVVVGKRSTCSRTNVGAVIAREGRVLSMGYNGVPAGLPHCTHECDCRHRQHDLDGFQPTDHEEACRVNTPCYDTVHAEANAIAFAARHGVSIEGAELFCTYSPCLDCAKIIVNAGISRVVWINEYRRREGVDLLQQARVRSHVLRHDRLGRPN